MKDHFLTYILVSILCAAGVVGKQHDCNYSSIHLPEFASDLPATEHQEARIVALGHGTQNYTCTGPGSTPETAGAVATLFDITCIAAQHPKQAEKKGIHQRYRRVGKWLYSRYYSSRSSLL